MADATSAPSLAAEQTEIVLSRLLSKPYKSPPSSNDSTSDGGDKQMASNSMMCGCRPMVPSSRLSRRKLRSSRITSSSGACVTVCDALELSDDFDALSGASLSATPVPLLNILTATLRITVSS